jgi:mono/diheme cytochrome c family protein
MKRYYVLLLLIATAVIFSYCSSGKKASKGAVPKMVYENSLQTLIVGNCSPCHIPQKGGQKKSYDNYGNVKADIDEIIRRIELNPGERGFMPFKKTEKLNDSTVAVFKQWKADGMLEK